MTPDEAEKRVGNADGLQHVGACWALESPRASCAQFPRYSRFSGSPAQLDTL